MIDFEPDGDRRARVSLPPDVLRPSGIVHGGALSTVIGAGVTMLRGPAVGLTGLRVQFLQPVTRLEVELELKTVGPSRIVEAGLLDQDGRTCAWGIVSVASIDAVTPPVVTQRAATATSDEPWRQLLDLSIDVDGAECDMSAGQVLDAWWAPVAYAATFADGPGAMLAGERADGAEFVTTTLTLDLERPLASSTPTSARGRMIGAAGRLRSFVSMIGPPGAPIGIGTATYFKIR